MKLSLVVVTPGKSEGKVIPIPVTEFIIGRDPQCHLRPASPIISKRHCAVLVRSGRAYVRDFNSTNGTLLNGQPVKGERALSNGDRLTIGPLFFQVRLEGTTPVDQPTPLPATKVAAPGDDDEAAAMLLALQDNDPVPDSPGVDSDGIPTGSTVMETLKPEDLPPAPEQSDKEAGKRYDKAKQAQADTSAAAKAILDKYIRRPRA